MVLQNRCPSVLMNIVMQIRWGFFYISCHTLCCCVFVTQSVLLKSKPRVLWIYIRLNVPRGNRQKFCVYLLSVLIALSVIQYCGLSLEDDLLLVSHVKMSFFLITGILTQLATNATIMWNWLPCYYYEVYFIFILFCFRTHCMITSMLKLIFIFMFSSR